MGHAVSVNFESLFLVVELEHTAIGLASSATTAWKKVPILSNLLRDCSVEKSFFVFNLIRCDE